MLKRSLLAIIFFFPIAAFFVTQLSQFSYVNSFAVTVSGQNIPSGSSQNKDVVSNLKYLSPKQLFDTANYYFEKNNTDTALMFYNILINKPAKDNDVDQQKRMVEAYTKAAIIYYYLCDFRSSHQYLIKALLLCEKSNYQFYEPKIYTNIGNIYYRFNQYDIAKVYYAKALNSCEDSTTMVILLNISKLYFAVHKTDSALYYIDLSNIIAEKNHFLSILTENNLTLSKIEEAKGRNKSALEYHKKYALLKDSVFNAEKFGDINQLQRLYEISKTDQQIDQLITEQQLQEETILYHEISQSWYSRITLTFHKSLIRH